MVRYSDLPRHSGRVIPGRTHRALSFIVEAYSATKNMETRTVSNLVLSRSTGRGFDEDGNGNGEVDSEVDGDSNGFLICSLTAI